MPLSYKNVLQERLEHSKEVIEAVIRRYSTHVSLLEMSYIKQN